MKNILGIFILLASFFTRGACAGACVPEHSDIPVDGALDVTEYLSNPKNNVAGYTIDIPVQSIVPKVSTVCTCNGYSSSSSYWDWSTFNVPTEVVGEHTYGVINEYLSFAVSPISGEWTPYENKEYKASRNLCTTEGTTGGGANILKLNIRRQFVGSVNIPRTLLYTKGTNTRSGEADRVPEIQFYISGKVTVPQSCELNAGNVIAIDFGEIGASLFSQAGAGNKPAGVNIQQKNITIKCNSIDAQTILTLRLETNEVSGNAIVSDNKDLGFIVADKDRAPLTPNNFDSHIPFRLDDNASASVPVTAWPVSITGKTPKEGTFFAEGYLRVDFD